MFLLGTTDFRRRADPPSRDGGDQGPHPEGAGGRPAGRRRPGGARRAARDHQLAARARAEGARAGRLPGGPGGGAVLGGRPANSTSPTTSSRSRSTSRSAARACWTVAARLFEERLDHERPLWRVDLVPMVGGGHRRRDADPPRARRRDHLAALRAGRCSGTTSRTRRPSRPSEWEPQPEPGRARTSPGATVRRRVGEVPGAVAGAVRGAANPSKWAHGAREVAKLPATVARELLPARRRDDPRPRCSGRGASWRSPGSARRGARRRPPRHGPVRRPTSPSTTSSSPSSPAGCVAGSRSEGSRICGLAAGAGAGQPARPRRGRRGRQPRLVPQRRHAPRHRRPGRAAAPDQPRDDEAQAGRRRRGALRLLPRDLAVQARSTGA